MAGTIAGRIENVVRAEKLRKQGLSNRQIAEVMGVTPRAVLRWVGKTPHPNELAENRKRFQLREPSS